MATPLRTLLARELAKQLFPDNAFYTNALRDGGSRGIAIDAKTVQVTEEGTIPDSVLDPTTFPLAATVRTDATTEYETHLFATKPTVVTDDEELLVNYDRRSVILTAHGKRLNTDVANFIAHAWASNADGTFLTTGTTSRTASAPGATGNRKKATKDDILKIQEYFDKLDILPQDRYAVLPTELYSDLAQIDDFINYEKRGLVDMISMGLIGEIYGFRIFKRSAVVNYDMTTPTTPVLRAIGAAGGANDSLAGIFWQAQTVRYAYGNPTVYVNTNRGEYLGTTLNTAVRSGGYTSYSDGKGVAMLIQDIA